MAKELPYFRFTAAEWLNGDISLEATYLKGVFIDICSYYWFKDCSLTKVMLKKKYNRDVDAINDLIKLDILKHDEETDYLTINFLNEQYDLLSEQRKRRQDAGSKGGKQKSSNAKAELKQSSSYKDKDKDNNKDKDKEVFVFKTSLLNLGVEKQIVSDYLKIRAKKSAVNSETAFNSIKLQIKKTNLSANDCIKTSVENSWSGFKADWLNNKSTKEEHPAILREGKEYEQF